ncbi:DUF397 domain-containing protein [Nocardia goodfellowii]|uniref:DUF397 domain-containing protein n=1 Tax=Nocardia goodfellowii TaxID=882446 RepID=A0ABS4Q9C4_9NOCA|nr:DUF397 domain-containing protein [Nocardia goodfellowii]MBP2188295.1 hypothetical protein [Nocardia goodfellowii]
MKGNVDLSSAVWRPSAGTEGTGVEVALLADGYVALRNGNEPDGGVLIFTPSEWSAFTAGVQDGEFDRPR